MSPQGGLHHAWERKASSDPRSDASLSLLTLRTVAYRGSAASLERAGNPWPAWP